MSIRRFLKGAAPAPQGNPPVRRPPRAPPPPRAPYPPGPTSDVWRIEASASGGPEEDRTWHEVERFETRPAWSEAPFEGKHEIVREQALERFLARRLDKARDTARRDYLAAPTWNPRPGDLARLHTPDGLVRGFYVFVEQQDALRALSVPPLDALWNIRENDPFPYDPRGRTWAARLGFDWTGASKPFAEELEPESWVALGATLDLTERAVTATYEVLDQLSPYLRDQTNFWTRTMTLLAEHLQDLRARVRPRYNQTAWAWVQAELSNAIVAGDTSVVRPAAELLQPAIASATGPGSRRGLPRAVRWASALLLRVRREAGELEGVSGEDAGVRVDRELMRIVQQVLPVPMLAERAARTRRRPT